MAPGMMMEGWDAVGMSTGPALGLGTNLGQYIEDLALCERHGDAEKLLRKNCCGVLPLLHTLITELSM